MLCSAVLFRAVVYDGCVGSLHRGGENPRQTARSCGEVPRAQKVPSPAHHMGRRGDELLLQGEEPRPPEGLVH